MHFVLDQSFVENSNSAHVLEYKLPFTTEISEINKVELNICFMPLCSPSSFFFLLLHALFIIYWSPMLKYSTYSFHEKNKKQKKYSTVADALHLALEILWYSSLFHYVLFCSVTYNLCNPSLQVQKLWSKSLCRFYTLNFGLKLMEASTLYCLFIELKVG